MKPHMPTIQLEQTLPFSHIFYIIHFFFREIKTRVYCPEGIPLRSVPSRPPSQRDHSPAMGAFRVETWVSFYPPHCRRLHP